MAFIEDEEKMQLFRKERKIQSIKEFNKTQVCYISQSLILINLGGNF
jgi:hypothetical protein